MSTDQKTLDTVLIMESDTDPTSGGGIAAPVGSYLAMEDGTGMYYKFSSGNTDWEFISPCGYTLSGTTVSLFNPVDAATYYFGFIVTLNTTEGQRYVTIPKTGKLIGIRLFIRSASSPDAQNSAFYFRLNNTTDHTISTTVVLANGNVLVSNLSMNVDVSDTDEFEIKWITPTWGTNPTSVLISWVAYFE